MFSASGLRRNLGRFFHGTCCATLVLASTSSLYADPTPSRPSRDVQQLPEEVVSLGKAFVDQLCGREELKVLSNLLEKEQDFLENGAVDLSQFPGYADLKPDAQTAIRELLEGNVSALVKELKIFSEKQGSDREELQQRWCEVRAHRYHAEIQLAEIESNQRAAGRLASIVSLDNRWFWFSGCSAVVVLSFVSWHDRRHEYRRRLNGAKARSLGVARMLRILMFILIGMTVVVFLFGGVIYDLLMRSGAEAARSRSVIDDEIEVVTKEREQLEDSVEKLREDVQQAYPERSNVDLLSKEWEQSRHYFERGLVSLSLKNQLADRLTEDLEELRILSDQQRAQAQEIEDYRRFRMLIRLGMGVAMMGLALGGGWAFLRGVQRRRKEIADTCPLCLGIGTLESENDDGHNSKLRKLKCNRVLDEEAYQECGFSFLSVYQELPKICFPTLGHPSAGKTHWLAMAYRELNQGNFDKRIRFQKVKSDMSEEYDRLVDEIINSRVNTAATQAYDVPHPLLFSFSDRDRWGKSSVLLNIFDYSGEVTQRMTLEDPQRRRMLDADGYIFFLDPTAPSEEQAKELMDFSEDVQIVRKTKAGQTIRAPVALCVSKIDLLVNQAYADPGGGGEIGQFYDELARLDEGNQISLEAIDARSDMIERLRDVIWPGWQIEQQVDQLFGGRFKFFPMTPVGLNELGETDLTNRTINPRWILEPLVWLLNMNGYPVLDDPKLLSLWR